MMLVTLGLASAVVGAVCAYIKMELKEYIDKNPTYASAIKNLTPELKVKFQDAARKLLSMADKIEQELKDEQDIGINPDLVA